MLVCLGHGIAYADVDADARLQQAKEMIQQGRDHAVRAEYRAALVSFDESIRLLDAIGDPVAATLIEPLIAAANVYAALGEPEPGIPVARRAVNVIRRTGGLYDMQQQPVVEVLVKLQAMSGNIPDSLAELRFLERASAETNGKRSVAHARVLNNVGQWFCRVGDFQSGRARFRKADEALLKLARRGDGNDVVRLQALTGMAQCYFFELASHGITSIAVGDTPFLGEITTRERLKPGSPVFRREVSQILRYEGERAMVTAAEIAESSQTLSMQERVGTLLQVGDWFLIKEFSRTALDYYERAYVLSRDNLSPDLVLQSPLQILYPLPRPLNEPARSDGNRPERYVIAEFTARADGRVKEVQVAEKVATPSMVDQTIGSLLAARYRPAFASGKPVPTADVRYRQSF